MDDPLLDELELLLEEVEAAALEDRPVDELETAPLDELVLEELELVLPEELPIDELVAGRLERRDEAFPDELLLDDAVSVVAGWVAPPSPPRPPLPPFPEPPHPMAHTMLAERTSPRGSERLMASLPFWRTPFLAVGPRAA